jgi:hypothetical protein
VHCVQFAWQTIVATGKVERRRGVVKHRDLVSATDVERQLDAGIDRPSSKSAK